MNGADIDARIERVLGLVRSERWRQISVYGLNENLLNGTGPEVRWAKPANSSFATDLEDMFRKNYEEQEQVTWMHLVREEIAEAFKEDNPELLAEELIQVAALCVSWVENLQQR